MTLFVSLITGGCSDYLNINDDPNNPIDVDHTTLIPTVQLYGTYALCAAEGLGEHLDVYTHQVSTREEANRYGVTGAGYYLERGWRRMYVTCLSNLELALQKAEKLNDTFSIGVLKVMKAHYYSQMVDVFGDIPFSEAGKTAEGIMYPKYDSGKDIYPQLFALLDEGIALLSQDGVAGGPYDLIYGGKANLWVKAAKTLKLKLYNQVRLVQDVKSEVQALLAKPEELIASTDESFMFQFGKSQSPDERHPGYPDSYAATQITNHISPWFFEIMKGINPVFSGVEDPRIPYYFYNQVAPNKPSKQKCEYRVGGFISLYFGSNGDRRDLARDEDVTVMGIYPVGGHFDEGVGGVVKNNGGTGVAPYRYLTYADRLFIEAELINAGLATGDEKAVFMQGVEESFNMVDWVVKKSGTSQTVPALKGNVESYLNSIQFIFEQAGSAEKRLEYIMTQKWIQSFGNSVDQYTDYRRTGYPIMFDPKTTPEVTPPAGGDPTEELPTVPVSCSLNYPASLPYVAAELAVNLNAPEQKNDLGNRKVFWDK